MEEPLQGSAREAVFRGRVRACGGGEGGASTDVMMKLKSHVELCVPRSVLLTTWLTVCITVAGPLLELTLLTSGHSWMNRSISPTRLKSRLKVQSET